MAFDIEMIKKVYANFSKRINEARLIIKRPLTLSEKILYAHPNNMCTIPMKNENIRSLNLATSVGIVLYEALRQING